MSIANEFSLITDPLNAVTRIQKMFFSLPETGQTKLKLSD